jgi:tetratricopeptide (TPR) repeat protein
LLATVVVVSLALAVSTIATAQDDLDRAAELLASGNYQEAFDLANAALERADDPRAHLMLAAASTKLGLFAKARKHLEIARELAPDLADLDYQFGVLEQTRGDEARAEGKTKRASTRYLKAVMSFDRELRTASIPTIPTQRFISPVFAPTVAASSSPSRPRRPRRRHRRCRRLPSRCPRRRGRPRR